MSEDTFIRPIEKIICQRTPRAPQFVRDQHVIRRNATDESCTGNFVAYCEDSRLAWVFWSGEIEAKRCPLSNLMDIDEWRLTRKQSTDLKNYWK